jgi:hypothetical protein
MHKAKICNPKPLTRISSDTLQLSATKIVEFQRKSRNLQRK